MTQSIEVMICSTTSGKVSFPTHNWITKSVSSQLLSISHPLHQAIETKCEVTKCSQRIILFSLHCFNGCNCSWACASMSVCSSCVTPATESECRAGWLVIMSDAIYRVYDTVSPMFLGGLCLTARARSGLFSNVKNLSRDSCSLALSSKLGNALLANGHKISPT